MVARRRVILTRSSRAASSAGTGARGNATGAGAGAGVGAGGGAATVRATSSFMIRPSRPVPCTWSGVRPASAMAFLALGASSTALAGAAFRSSFGAGGASVFAGVAAAPSVMTARRALAATVVPSGARISASTPVTGLGTSTETLSVSSSHSISSCFTASPGFLNQVDTVASDTDSPRAGTITSVIRLLRSAGHRPRAWATRVCCSCLWREARPVAGEALAFRPA